MSIKLVKFKGNAAPTVYDYLSVKCTISYV